VAGFTANSDGTVFIGAQLDADSVDAIAKVIEAACSRGVTQGFAEFKKIFNSSATADGVKKIQDAVNAAGKSAVQAGNGAKVFSKNLNAASQEAYNLSEALERIGQLEKAIAAAQYRARSTERQGAITDRERFSRDAQRRIETLKGENSRAASGAQGAAQQQVVAARYAGKQRVLIVQEVLRTIGRLEKALGATIAGIARTATSAISKSFSGLTSTLSKFGSSLRRTDSGFNQTLPRELRTRETLIRSSFSRQEKELRSSTIRQQRITQQARTATSTGVLGAVTGRGIGGGIAALGLGVGIFSQLTGGYADAVNFNEQVNKNKVVFGQFADAVFDFVRNAPSDLGATKAAVLEATGTFGNLFRAIGIDEGQSTMLSVSLTKIATDISSFNNVDIGDVFTNLRAGLVGEAEPLRKFGIDVSDARLRHEAFLLGISDGKSVLTAGQKAQAAYAAIVKDSALAEGDFTRTANEGANAARRREAAIRQLFSTIAGKLKPVLTALNVGLIGTAAAIANFVDGSVGPGLLIVRDGLIGVAVGLGAVLAAKGAVEVIKLLAVAAQLALSPMGLLLVGVATVGAAFNVLRTRSADFREAISLLGRYLVTQGSRIWDGIITAVHTVIDAFARTEEAVSGTADRIEREVKPASRFFRDLGDTIKRALFTATSFIVEKVIPALAEFAIFVGRNFVPAVSVAVGVVLGLVDRVVDIAKGIYTYVRPGLQTAIDGFHELANAIGAAFSGDFSGLEKQKTKLLIALTAGVTGLAIGGPILGAVAAAAVLVGPAIGKALQPIGRRVAEFFTELFSGPNIKRYISGVLDFVEAVGRTIGTIVSSPLFLKAVAAIAAAAVVIGFRFVKGFIEGVASNLPSFGDVLQAGLGLIFDNLGVVLGIALAAAIFGPRLLGLFRTGGATAGTSFASGLRGAASVGSIKAFFGGPAGFVSLAKTNGQDAAKAMFREFNRNNNLLRTAGLTPISKQGFFLPASKVEESRAAVAKLKTSLGEAGTRALELRNRMGETMALIKGSPGVVRGIGVNFAHATATGATGLTRLKDTFSLVMRDIRQLASENGLTAGRTLVNGLRTGAEAGLAVLGGFMAGRAEGAAGGSGLLSAATAGLTAGLITQNPVIGVAAAGASLLGTAFGKAGAAAKALKEDVKRLAASLKAELNDAVDKGVISLEKLNAGLLDIGDIAGFDSLKSGFRDALGGDGVKVLNDFGLSWSRDIRPILKSGGDADQLKEKLRSAFLDAASSSGEFTARFGTNASKIQDLVAGLLEPGGGASFDDLLDQNIDTRFFQPLLDQEEFIKGVIDTANDLNTAANNAANALDGINDASLFFSDAPPPKGWIEFISSLGKAPTGGGFVGRMKDAADSFTPALKNHATALEEATREVDVYASRLVAAKGASDSLFNIPNDTSLQETIDKAMIAVDGLGPRVADALKNGGVSADAQVREIIRGMGDNISSVLKQGIDEGMIVDAATARSHTQSIFDAAVAGIPKDSQAYADAAAAYEAAIEGVEPNLKEINAADAALSVQTQIEAYLKANPLATTVEATVAVSNKNKIIDLRGDSAGRQALASGKAPKVDIPSSSKTQGEWWRFGSDIATGAARGVTANTYKPVTAAVIMASKMAIAARKQSGISSPSKVFRQIGVFMGEGLAVGLQSTAALVSGAATRLVDRVVAAARSAGSGAADALKGVGSDIFAGMVGSGAELNTGNSLLQARGALTTAFSSLRDSLSGEGATTTLDINDALGVANIQQLTGAFDAIAEFGQVMLSQGVDASTVAIQLQQQVDVLTQLAVSMGFDQAGVAGLADSLGLSGAALGQFVSTAADAAAQIRQIAADLAATDLYQKSFGSQATGPNGNAGALASAQAGVTTAVQSVLSNFDTQIGQVFTLGASDYSKLNAADKALFDEIKAGKALSTDTTTVLGSANLTTLTGAFDAIANLGQVMISQGSSAADVAAELKKQTAAATAKATALGFSVSTVAGVAAGLGLSNVAIDGYVTGAAAAAAAAAAPAPGAAAATAAVYALPPAAIPVYHPPVAPAAAAPSGPFTPSTAAEDAASAAANAAFVAQLINSGMLTTSGGSGLSGGPDPQAFINAVGPGLAKVIQQAIRAGG